MVPLLEQDFYQLLEVPRDAATPQIERAYRIARITWQPSSTATYSIYSTEEAAAILRRIEEAFAVLSDAQLRREYDLRLKQARSREEALGRKPAIQVERISPTPEPDAAPEPRQPEPARADDAAPAASNGAALEFDESLEPADGVYDGPALRRIRMSLGIELEEISSMTKVNEPYLDAIEANRYEDLPPPVYVRGFVKEFAKCVGLDGALAAETYLKRMETHRGARS